MLARLKIRQKLNLLLILPLIAVILTTVPLVAERIGSADASVATSTAARSASDIAGLIQDLQLERLLAVGYLTTGQMDRDVLLAQIQTSADDTARLRAAPGTRTELSQAASALDTVSGMRAQILARGAAVSDVYTAYRTAVHALIGSLQLSDRPGVDAPGMRRLAALDALMRANEEAASLGAALVALVSDQTVAPLLQTALAALDQQDERFDELAEAPQVQLVDLVEHGQAGVRIRRLADNLDTSDVAPGPARAAAALTVAASYVDLRRIAQDRVLRDIATAAQSQAVAAQVTAVGTAAGGLILFVLVVGLSTIVSRSISSPLRRLSRAAGLVADLAGAELTRVADSDQADVVAPKLRAVEISGTDEIGELATAINRVQATAAMLLERQVSTRRNVGIMFANIARRTQTLVGRQIMLIDDLERTERNTEMLEKLYRLDHVATRLRRSAEALLVVSGTQDDGGEDVPVPLSDVIRSAVAEIEGYRSVRLGVVCDVSVDVVLVGDLRLLLAELLENAASFSAPGTLVDVYAEFEDAGDTSDCVISIVDHGIGMTRARLADENQRLVERERLDVAPTTVLGLFVVGRLARRHGLAVRLAPTPGQGVTASVVVPARLLVADPLVRPGALPARTAVAVRPASPTSALAAALAVPADEFAWFTATPTRPELEAAPTPAPTPTPDPASGVVVKWVPTVEEAPAPPPEQRGGLSRRVPGNNLPAALAGPTPAAPSGTARPVRDPSTERDELDDFLDGLDRARRSQPSTGDRE